MRLWIAAVFAACLPSVSVADEFDDRRASCVPLVTAVYDDCSLQNHRRCAGGEYYVEGFFPEVGPFASLYGPDYELVYQREMSGGPGIDAVVQADDRFSMTSLLSTGTDHQNLIVSSSMAAGIRQNARLQSTTKLTDQSYSVSGQSLQVVTVRLSLELGFGGNAMVIDGRGYLDPSQGLIFAGPATHSFSDEAFRTAPELVAFIFPDEPFFMSQTPEEVCQAQLSFLTPYPILQVENQYDNL